jgi:predicted small secreted protein
MKPILVVLALGLLTGLALGGCSNTFEGMGRDVERAGQSIQRTF